MIDAIAGEPLEIWKINAVRRYGDSIQSARSELRIHKLFRDRWRLFPTAPGAYNFEITDGAFTGSIVVNVSPALPAGAAAKRVCFVGDSTTVTLGHGGFVKYVKDALGARITLVGTQSTAGYLHEGRSGRTWQWFATDPASPFANIPAWSTSVGGAPDAFVISLGINDFFGGGTLASSVIDTAHGHANNLIAALKVQFPAAKFFLSSLFPGHRLESPWTAVGTTWALWKQRHHQVVGRQLLDFDNRTAENIFVPRTHLTLDPVFGYEGSLETVHPAVLTGHVTTARTLRHSLVARLYG